MHFSSIRRIGSRATAKTRILADPTKPKIYNGKTFPDWDYTEQINVYDCNNLLVASSEDFLFNPSKELIYHYKWGDPRFLNLSIGLAVPPGSVGRTGLDLA